MSLSTRASGEPIRESAKSYFNEWSNSFHAKLTASARSTVFGIPDPRIIPDAWQKSLPAYQNYEVARDWAEDAAAPFPLPIEVYVFGLVRRWPAPATEEQAVQDCKVLLKTFGKDRVLEVAKKVQAAMNQNGEIPDPDALGVTQQNMESGTIKALRENLEKSPNAPEYQRKIWKEELELCSRVQQNKTSFYSHNPYWALWALLTKDDPKLTQLYQLYRDQKRGTGTDPSYLRKSVYALQPIVDEWNGIAPSTPAPTPSAPTPTPVPTPTPTPTPTPVPTPTAGAADTYKALIPRTAQEIEKINALRHEYVNEWSKLTERYRNWYNDQDADFETQTIRSTGAEEIALLHNRIDSIQGSLRLEDNENRVKRSDGIPIPIPTPMPTPPPLSPVGVSILVQDYNKMWEFTYAEYQFQSSVNRGTQGDGEIANGLVDQELAFRASLKGLDQSNQIQKLTWRMKYFGNLHSQIFHNGRKLEEWEPHRPSGLERLDLSAKPTLAPAPTLTPTRAPTPTPTPAPTPTPTPTPYPETADLWREREHVVKQEYDKAWTALPDTIRLRLNDEEVTFQDTIKTFDPPTRILTLKHRIEHFKSLAPRSTLASVPTLTATPAPTVVPGATVQEELRLFFQQYDKMWEATFAALPNNSRLALRDQELRFRDTLKGLDAQTVLQKLKQRVLYFKQITPAKRDQSQ